MTKAIRPLEDEVCEFISRWTNRPGKPEIYDTLEVWGVSLADIPLLIALFEEHFGVSVAGCSIIPKTQVGFVCDAIQEALYPSF